MLRKNPWYGDAKKELVMALLNGKDVSQEAFLALCEIVGVTDDEFIAQFAEQEQEDEDEKPVG